MPVCYSDLMPTPQQLMASVPYAQRTGGSPAGDAIRNLIQQDAIQKKQASLKFQDGIAQQNAAATQPFGDEQTPESLMQQAAQMQQPPAGTPVPGQPPQASIPTPGMQVNPQSGPSNPQAGMPPANAPSPPPKAESLHTGGPKFDKGRRYV